MLPNIFLQGTPHQLFPVLMAGQPSSSSAVPGPHGRAASSSSAVPGPHGWAALFIISRPWSSWQGGLFTISRPWSSWQGGLFTISRPGLHGRAASSLPAGPGRRIPVQDLASSAVPGRCISVLDTASSTVPGPGRRISVQVQFLQQHQDDAYLSKWCRPPPRSVDGKRPPDCVPDFDAPAWNRFSWHACLVFCTPRLVSLASKSGRGPCGGLLINSVICGGEVKKSSK